MARDVIVFPNDKNFMSEIARDWAEQYAAAIPGVRDSADVGGSGNWSTLAMAIANRIVPTLAGPATLCFLGGEQKSCAPVPGVSPATQTVTLCSPHVALDPEIVFYNVPAPSGPQQGKSLRAMDEEAISKGSTGGPPQLRRTKRRAFDDIGTALANKVMAVELLAIDATIDMSIAKQLCAEWKVMVGGYKKPITLNRIDGRARLFFKGDPPDAFVPGAPGRPGFVGSNNPKAETDVPPFDQNTAFLFRPGPNGSVTQTVG
jgi:hypothetical protein